MSGHQASYMAQILWRECKGFKMSSPWELEYPYSLSLKKFTYKFRFFRFFLDCFKIIFMLLHKNFREWGWKRKIARLSDFENVIIITIA